MGIGCYACHCHRPPSIETSGGGGRARLLLSFRSAAEPESPFLPSVFSSKRINVAPLPFQAFSECRPTRKAIRPSKRRMDRVIRARISFVSKILCFRYVSIDRRSVFKFQKSRRFKIRSFRTLLEGLSYEVTKSENYFSYLGNSINRVFNPIERGKYQLFKNYFWKFQEILEILNVLSYLEQF